MRKLSVAAGLVLALGFGQDASSWRPMFEGKTLENWRETPFEGRGLVSVQDGAIRLGTGMPLTGINWTGPFPTFDYEVRFEAARLSGNDFFASLTFPVVGSHATWVLGGWGGDIVGLSSIDGWDASDNETRSYFTFETGRWYKFRLQVTDGRIAAWIDEERVISLDFAGRTISLRPGPIKLSAPFGFASYGSTGALRKIDYRQLSH